MTEFHKALFRTNHKSFYTHQDVVILDECRSIVPSGSFTKGVDHHLVEVDISKAFTAAFCSIKEIPIFNEFDNFKLYSDLPIKKLSLYIVKVKNCIFFFKKIFCLVYGMFLQHFKNDVEILYYKDPSFIKKVKYSDIVKQLYDAQISDKEEEDNFLKKLIANVNCGLLEK